MTGHADHSPAYPLLKQSLLFAIGLACTFSLYSQQKVPVITAVLPYSGPVGTVVTINGANFDAVASRDTVFFGGVRAQVSSARSNSLTVSVPAGAVYAPISVTVNRLTAYSNPFTPVFTGGGNIDSSSFGSRTSYGVGASPVMLATADFDGDGRSDLAGVMTDANQVVVIRNGSGSTGIAFGNADTFATGAAPRYVVTADFNGDGKPDMAVANRNDNSVSVFQDSSVPGKIFFLSKIDFGTGVYPIALATADLDGDGKVDLVTADSVADSVSVFSNITAANGPISFAARMSYAAGSGPVGIAFGDLDGDGLPDMVVCDATSNQIFIFRNTSAPGAISFAPVQNFQTGAISSSVAIADLDGDGKPDVIVTNPGANSVSVFQNASSVGVVGFAAAMTFGSGGGPACLSVSDVNGDGKPDITVADVSSNSAAVLQNGSSGGRIVMAPPVLFFAGFGPTGILSGDFDGDGRPDMALSNYGGSLSDSISILRNLTGVLRYPSIDSFSPASGRRGDTVVLHGHFFTTTSAVSFGGVAAASYQVLSDSLIAAVLGTGGSGLVAVTTGWGFANRGAFTFLYDTVVNPPTDSIPPRDSLPPLLRVFELLDFTGLANGGQVQLRWRVAVDSSITYYVVQYGPDSVNFDAIGSVRAKGADTAEYSFTDRGHSAGIDYYRLKIEDTALHVSYSPIVVVGGNGTPEMLTVFPNPASDVVTVIVPGTLNNSGFELVDMAGKIVEVIPVKAGVTQVSIYVRMFSRGVYKLMWTDGVNQAFTTLMVIRK